MEGDFEVDDSPYKLKSWIADGDCNSGIDERDPLRFDLLPIQLLPSDHVCSELSLQFAYEDQPRWRNSTNGEVVFAYEAWSDVRWSDGGERILLSEDIHSSGYQLTIGKNSLREYLDKVGMDLIVEIQITQEEQGFCHLVDCAHYYIGLDCVNPEKQMTMNRAVIRSPYTLTKRRFLRIVASSSFSSFLLYMIRGG